jgi:DNA replication and repair protein RecF
MFVTVSLQNYRNIKELSLKDLGSNIVISGSNGQGKSNLLEAIFLSTTGRSFRPMNNLSETIGVEGEFNRIELISKNEDILEMIVSLHDSRLSRKYTLNTKKRSIGTITSKFPVLLFAPHSVDLVSNEPGTRRDDLDSFLVSLSTDYRHAYERYIKVLKNRNALLKAIREQKATRAELGYWTEELINLAGKIYEYRDSFFTAIRPFISQAASKLYSKKSEKDFSIKYIPASVGEIRDGIQDITYDNDQKEKYINVLSNKFADNLEKEIIVGKTLYGPHKDDYELTLKGRNLRYQGSIGQQ